MVSAKKHGNKKGTSLVVHAGILRSHWVAVGPLIAA